MKYTTLLIVLVALIIGGLIIKSFSSPQQDWPKVNPQPSPTISERYLDYTPNLLSTLTGDIVLFFHADRCPTCIQAEKNFFMTWIPEGLTIIKVDFDSESELRKKYSILSQTSYVYVKNDGTMLKRRVGWLTIDNILENVIMAKWSVGETKTERQASNQTAKAYFAGGCFRCMEWPFESLEWVKEVISWYIWWDLSTATYKQVSSWKTQHKEAVEVIYDPALISYEELLPTYRRQIDPTDEGGQFADRWPQYRIALYYSTLEEEKIAREAKATLEASQKFSDPIIVEILPQAPFFAAEEEHQDYYKKNTNSYERYKKWSGRAWFIEDNRKNDEPKKVISRKERIPKTADDLTEQQRTILFEWWTEPPFDNAYRDNHEAWIYVDVIDGTPLFSSTDKFDSGTWRPSFTRPIQETIVDSKSDSRFGMERTEIKSSSSNGHLWHVFNDGPVESGWIRYCINSAALEFVPAADLDAKGYTKYKTLFIKE